MASAGQVYQAEDGTISTVLEDHHDADYEPTAAEIEEYAQFLGIDTTKEKELLWISREGLKAPLPSEWKPCKTDKDEVYYFNFETGDSIWDHPLDDVYKSKVVVERGKLKAGNYVPPPGAHSGAAGSREKEIEMATKKKKKKVADDCSKVLKKGAAGDCGLEDNQTPSSIGPTGSLGSVSETKLFGKLGVLGPIHRDRNKPDISMLLSDTKDASILNKGKPRDSASVLKDANISAEQRIRGRLEQDYVSKKASEEVKLSRILSDIEEEFDRKVQKIERDADAELEEEVQNVRRIIDRRLKMELQTFEEGLDCQEENLKRSAKQLRDKLHELQMQIDMTSGRKDVATEIKDKKASVNNDARAEIDQKRTELHNDWQKEKNCIEEKTMSEVQAYRKVCEDKLAAENAKILTLWTNNYNELEYKLRDEIETLKKDLEKQKSDKLISNQEAENDKEHTYRAAEKNNDEVFSLLKKNMTRKVEEVFEFTKQNFTVISNAHDRAKEKLIADYDEKVAQYEKRKHTQKLSIEDAVADHIESLKKKQYDYEFKMENDIQMIVREFESDTVKEVRALSRKLSDALVAKIESNEEELDKNIELSRNDAVKEIEEAVIALKSKHHAELDTLQEKMNRVERNRSKAIQDVHKSTISASSTKLESKKKVWLEENPESSFILPPALLSNNTVTSLSHVNEMTQILNSDTHEAAKADVNRRLVELQKKLRDEVQEHITECKERATREMEERLIRYKKQAKEDAIHKLTRKYQEKERQEMLQIQLSSSSANTAGALMKIDKNMNVRKAVKSVSKDDPSRSIKRILRRQQMRDEMEEKRRLECSKRESEISRRTTLEKEKLEKRLQDLTAKLSRDMTALSNDISLHSSQQLDQHNRTSQQNNSLLSRRSSPNLPPNSALCRTQLPIQSDCGSIHSHSPEDKKHHNNYANYQQHQHFHTQFSDKTTPLRTLVVHDIEGNIGPSAQAHIHSSNPYYQGCPTSFGERIARAWKLVNSHKKKLKARREAIEASRADWRIDMAAAKLGKETAAIALLRKVHKSMEVAARRLNDETRELQSTIKYLKEQEAAEVSRRASTATGNTAALRGDNTLYQHYKNQQFSSPSASHNRLHYSHVDPQQNLEEVLQTVLEKANIMEKRFAELEREQAALLKSNNYNNGGSNEKLVRMSSHDLDTPLSPKTHKRKKEKDHTAKRVYSQTPQGSSKSLKKTDDVDVNKWLRWFAKEGETPRLPNPTSTINVPKMESKSYGTSRDKPARTVRLERDSSPNLNVVDAWLKDIKNH